LIFLIFLSSPSKEILISTSDTHQTHSFYNPKTDLQTSPSFRNIFFFEYHKTNQSLLSPAQDSTRATIEMADAVVEATAKLHLDEETGEMVSKNELKKRMQKRAKKAAAKAQVKEATPQPKRDPVAKKEPDEAPVDPDAMFKQGFLASVYQERPTGEKTVTRFPPEPNVGRTPTTVLNTGL
jgi:hypothetical protein